jgi:small GTP-binding protein
LTASLVTVTLCTAPTPGAIGLVQLCGSDTVRMLASLTGCAVWTPGVLRRVSLADIDDGMAVLLRDDLAQLMPHGGPRVMQRLLDQLLSRGATLREDVSAADLYPEAVDELEADALATLALAASPAAVDLLLAQPPLWRRRLEQGEISETDRQAIRRDSDRFDRLIVPPSVVVVGPPNVGKSTLTNRMLGRSASVVADLPGTTRDWVAGLAELLPASADIRRPLDPARDSVAVRWTDTPGLHASNDLIEQAAIDLAREVILAADLLIALRDADSRWPDITALGREPDLWAVNKIDDPGAHRHVLRDAGRSARLPMPLSAHHNLGIEALTAAVLDSLDLAIPTTPTLWAFTPRLREAVG